MFKKFASGILPGLFGLPAFGFMPTDDFEVIHTQTVGDTGGIEFLADIAGAVQVGKDYRPTSDTSSPLYKFKALTYFLQNGEKMSGHVASINIINCHDRTFLQGMTWYYVDDHAPPTVIPPQSDFEPMNDTHAFYPVAKHFCQFTP